ncbi:MAG: hypothetical protein Ta2B_30540 [Termitinemataceae bacterium]|nr:MAG: hypothetical protein Ta2B_30540 [Termitinemataceae bacterium]
MGKKVLSDRGSAENAINAANSVLSKDFLPQSTGKPRPTAVGLNENEYLFLKKVFDAKGNGVKLSTAMKMAALWVAQQVDDGAMSISRAGIIDKRI